MSYPCDGGCQAILDGWQTTGLFRRGSRRGPLPASRSGSFGYPERQLPPRFLTSCAEPRFPSSSISPRAMPSEPGPSSGDTSPLPSGRQSRSMRYSRPSWRSASLKRRSATGRWRNAGAPSELCWDSSRSSALSSRSGFYSFQPSYCPVFPWFSPSLPLFHHHRHVNLFGHSELRGRVRGAEAQDQGARSLGGELEVVDLARIEEQGGGAGSGLVGGHGGPVLRHQPPLDRGLAVHERDDGVDVAGHVEQPQPVGRPGLELHRLGLNFPVEHGRGEGSRNHVDGGTPGGKHQNPIGLRVEALARLQYQQRSVESRADLLLLVEMRVIHEGP